VDLYRLVSARRFVQARRERRNAETERGRNEQTRNIRRTNVRRMKSALWRDSHVLLGRVVGDRCENCERDYGRDAFPDPDTRFKSDENHNDKTIPH
jgi:hypothetical protein